MSKSPSSESVQLPSPPSPIEQRVPFPSPPSFQEPMPSPPSPPTTPTEESKEIPPPPVTNEYDEDFSEVSRSPINTPTKPIIDELEIESIHEDLEEKPSLRDANQSSTSKSSADEQSAILVLGRSSATNTPRQQEEKALEEDEVLSIPTPVKIESDNTSHDVSEEEERTERGGQIDRIIETLARTFIDEAIDQSKEIETTKLKIPMTKEASEWMSDEDLTDEDTNKQTATANEEDVE